METTGDPGVGATAATVISVDRWGGSNAARSAQAPVRAPPQGAATVIAVVRATGDIVGRVVVFGLFGSIIGHLLRGESAVCTSRSTACKRVSTRRSRRSLAPCRSSPISSGRGRSNPFPSNWSSRAVSSPSRGSPRTVGPVAFVQRWGTRSAVTIVDVAGGPERMLTASPDPRPGRSMGGGCFDWLADGSGVVYVGVDGELWLQRRGGPPRRLTTFERSCAAPAVAPTGSFVVAVVDEAEVWLVPIGVDDAAPRRLDDGRRCLLLRPGGRPVGPRGVLAGVEPTRHAVGRGARVPARRRRSERAGATLASGRWCGPAASPHAQRRADVRARRLGLAERVRRRSSRCCRSGSSRRGRRGAWVCARTPWRPTSEPSPCAGTNSASAGSRSSTSNVRRASIDVARSSGVHGQVSWVGDSIVALRSGARTPTQIVRYDVDAVRTHGPRGRPRRRMGRRSTSPSRSSSPSDTTAPSCTLAGTHAARGRLLVWVHGGPTDQWQVDFRPRLAYWWSRGWDVLVVDPRGSTGHGRAYQRALNGAWGRLDVDDTAALVARRARSGLGQSGHHRGDRRVVRWAVRSSDCSPTTVSPSPAASRRTRSAISWR